MKARSSTLVVVLFSVFVLCNHTQAENFTLVEFEKYSWPQTPAKFALIIGVEQYRSFSVVQNALNDAHKAAWGFLDAGFDFVRVVQNPDTADEVLDSLKEIELNAKSTTQPVIIGFYFAGHGFQLDGTNYLVLSMARNGSTDELIEDSLSLTTVLRHLVLNRKAAKTVVFLDACRTARYLDTNGQSPPMREDLKVGFNQGSIIAPAVVSMAAEPGKAALSVSQSNRDNSPYTNSVSRLLSHKSMSLATLLENSLNQVLQDTQQIQRPTWFNGSGTLYFYFVPGQIEKSREQAAWSTVSKSGQNLRNCTLAYLERYPAGEHSVEAEYLHSIAPIDTTDYCVLD